MRVLFVWSSAEFSTWDVARGYRKALDRAGHDVRDYRLYARIRYHAQALGERGENLTLLARMASENIVVEAMKHRAQLVLIISGMALHPDALWFLRSSGFRTAVLFTESPYNDTEQRAFHAAYPEMMCFTNERTSATDGWHYLPHAYDPEVHTPQLCEKKYDVLLIGTLWQDRIQLLDAVDWTGIRLKLIGTWVAPPLPGETHLGQYYEEGCVPNAEVPAYYSSARLCLNPHRAHATAESLNPRTYELAACQAFQITDPRAELYDVFGSDGGRPVVFHDWQELSSAVRYWLRQPDQRLLNSTALSARYIRPYTFDARLQALMSHL